MRNTAIAFTLSILLNVTADAAPITYTFSGTGSGSVGATTFSDSAFTIQVFADTSLVQGSFVLTVEDISSTFDITGIGSGLFTAGERVFVFPGISTLGFSQSQDRGGFDLIDLQHPAFATYDLRSSFGPVFVATPFVNFNNEPSTLGAVSFTSAQNITFTAAIVPEPSSLMLLGGGLFLLLLGIRRAFRTNRGQDPSTNNL